MHWRRNLHWGSDLSLTINQGVWQCSAEGRCLYRLSARIQQVIRAAQREKTLWVCFVDYFSRSSVVSFLAFLWYVIENVYEECRELYARINLLSFKRSPKSTEGNRPPDKCKPKPLLWTPFWLSAQTYTKKITAAFMTAIDNPRTH